MPKTSDPRPRTQDPGLKIPDGFAGKSIVITGAASAIGRAKFPQIADARIEKTFAARWRISEGVLATHVRPSFAGTTRKRPET